MVSALFDSTASLEQAVAHYPLLVTPDTLLTEAIAQMSSARGMCLLSEEEILEADLEETTACASCVLVAKSNELLGIFTDRDVVRLGAAGQSLVGKTIADVMAQPVISVRQSELTDLFSALNLLHHHRIRHLPIRDEADQIIGVLTHERLQRLLRPIDLLRLRLVSEVMVHDVVCAPPDASVLEVAQRMAHHRVSSVVIVQAMESPGVGAADGDRPSLPAPLGIITEQDIVQFFALGLSFATIQAQTVMSSPVFTVRPHDSLWAARALMVEKRLGRIVVTGDRGELLGIVTQTTLLQTLNPVEMYKLLGVLEQKICRLEADKLDLLQNRTLDLERQVQERTLALQKQAEREHLLAEIATQIRASLNLGDTLQEVVSQTRSLLQCDRVLVYQFNPDWSGVVTAEDVLPGWSVSLANTITDCCFQDKAQQLYRQGRKHTASDIYASGYPDCYIQMLERYQVKANLVVPILVEQQLWGLLIAHQCGQCRDWDGADLELLDKIAVQVAIAIQQAMAYERSQAELRERQRAEEVLQQETLRKRIYFDTSLDGIVVLDHQGNVVETNSRFAAMLGYLPEELAGMNVDCWDIQFNAGELQAMREEERKRANHPPVQPQEVPHTLLETRHRRRDGSTYDVEISYSSVIWEGQLLHFCVCRDITERKRVEQALLQSNQELERHIQQRNLELQQSEARFRKVFEQSPLGIAISDLDGQIDQVNASLKHLLSYPEADLLQSSIQALILPSARPAFADQLEQLCQQTLPVMAHEVPLLTQQGTTVWATMTSALIVDAFGHPSDIIHLIEDISDRKTANDALARQLAAIEAAIDGIAILEGDTFTYVNKAHLDLFGYQHPQDLLGKRWAMLYSPEELQRIQQDVFPLLLQHNHWQGEAIATRQDGSTFIEGLSLTLAGNGELICVCRDITAQRQAEDQIQQANQRLILSNAELARATRLRDEFLANMSHELRTPLNAILGMAEGLQEKVFGPLNTNQEQAIATMERGGRHLLDLINDILDLSKIESGKLELQIAPASVNYLCESSLTFIRQQAVKKNIRLTADIPSGLPDIAVDDRRLRQILINLLSNAVKFTPEEGAVQLVVSTETENSECFILFSVHDTGIGIAPDDLNKLFQPFTQIDSSLTRQHAGTGLGLSLVRQLAELHQGTVTVGSEVGRGSCFTLRLPYVCPASTALPTAPSPLQRPIVRQPSTPPATVLVVEDDAAAVDHVSRYLSEMGLHAIVCQRGQGVVEKAAQQQPALIMLDILLPDMSGWGLLNQLKANPSTQTIPVLIVSVMDERSRGLSAGAVEYLVKPITRERLQDVFNTLQLPIQPTAPRAVSSSSATAPPLVLLVEDNPANVATLSGYLKNRGFRLVLAEDGAEAIDLTVAHHPDLILMDIQMPKMNGFDAIRQIRADAAIAHTPIIALTALAMPHDRERCIEAGADDYISKPVRLKSLVDLMQRLLDQRSSA